MTSTIAVVRGKRGRPHSSANAIRNRVVSTSAMPTAPPTSQCTFSHVAQKRSARKSPPASLTRGTPFGAAGFLCRSHEPSQDLGELLHARAAAEPLAVLGRERRSVEGARLPT